MKRLSVIVTALGLLLTLSGCHDAKTQTTPHPATAEAASVYTETAKAGDVDLTLTIDPLQVGENRFIVTVGDTSIRAVEAQVVMATMGHGQVIDLKSAGEGRFEAKSTAIEMDGRWMIRIKATAASGETKDATFHLVVKAK